MGLGLIIKTIFMNYYQKLKVDLELLSKNPVQRMVIHELNEKLHLMEYGDDYDVANSIAAMAKFSTFLKRRYMDTTNISEADLDKMINHAMNDWPRH